MASRGKAVGVRHGMVRSGWARRGRAVQAGLGGRGGVR